MALRQPGDSSILFRTERSIDTLPGSKRKPLTPLSTRSDIPPQRDPITGVPLASASSPTLQKFSYREGIVTTSAFLKKAGMVLLQIFPIILHLCKIPGFL